MADPRTTAKRSEPPRGLRVVPRETVVSARGLGVRSRERAILRDVDLDVGSGEVYAIIGPSGVGKSTLLRCMNRLVDLDGDLSVTGRVEVLGRSVRDPDVDADALRSRVGILFQQPVVFPGTVEENVLFGLRRVYRLPKAELRERARVALEKAALWAEVRERLDEPAAPLSVGQRQRLCLARTLAMEPPVILMDEPTSALDPRATDAIEELIVELKRDHTIVLVTHDLGQARRVADVVSCLCLRRGAGELAESAVCENLFSSPKQPEVIDFLTRRSSSHE